MVWWRGVSGSWQYRMLYYDARHCDTRGRSGRSVGDAAFRKDGFTWTPTVSKIMAHSP